MIGINLIDKRGIGAGWDGWDSIWWFRERSRIDQMS